MTPFLSHRPPAREAGPELLVLARWEELAGWLFVHAGRWPRSVRFTLTSRVQDRVLEVAELFVEARYRPRERAALLSRANLLLERLRLLLRIARSLDAMPRRSFENAMRGVDEVGRMAYGWRKSIETSRDSP